MHSSVCRHSIVCLANQYKSFLDLSPVLSTCKTPSVAASCSWMSSNLGFSIWTVILPTGSTQFLAIFLIFSIACVSRLFVFLTIYIACRSQPNSCLSGSHFYKPSLFNLRLNRSSFLSRKRIFQHPNWAARRLCSSEARM